MYPKPLSSGPNCDLNSLNCDPLAVTPSLLSLKMNVALQTIWGSVKYDCVKYCVPTHHSIPLLSAITSMYASLIASLSMAVDILCCKTTRNEVKTNKNITEDAIRFYFYPPKVHQNYNDWVRYSPDAVATPLQCGVVTWTWVLTITSDRDAATWLHQQIIFCIASLAADNVLAALL